MAKTVWKTDLSDVVFIFNKSFRQNVAVSDIIDYLDSSCGHNFCNLMFKAYIEWWVRNKFMEEKPNFKDLAGKKRYLMGCLKNRMHMAQFVEAHGISKDLKSKEGVENLLSSYKRCLRDKPNKKKSVHRVTKKEMDKYYALGISTILSECGIVLTGNYLMRVCGKDFKGAAFDIGRYLHDLNVEHGKQRATLKRIFEKTCEGSPYYEKMDFLNWITVYEKIIARLGDDVDLSDYRTTGDKRRNSYNFLVEKETVTA